MKDETLHNFRYCVVLPCKGDAEAFGRSLAGIKRAVRFEQTLILWVFEKEFAEKRPYELEEDLFAATEDLPENARIVYGAEKDRILSAASEHGCEVVVFLDEGDSPNPHFLEYAGYFFDDADACGAVAAPLSASGESLSPLFADIPPGGVKPIGAETVPPLSARGTAVSVAALAEAGFPPDLSAEEAFLYVFLKTALREGRIGLLPAFVSTEGAAARPVTSRVLESLAEDFADGPGGLPPMLSRLIETHAEAQLGLPPDEADADTPRLLAHAPDFTAKFAESLGGLPCAEIENIENYYADVRITGVLRSAAGAPTPHLRVRAPAKLLSFETAPADERFADRVFPRVRFAATLRPDENGVAELRFFSGRRAVSDVLVTEKEDRARPFRNYALSARKNAVLIEKLAPRPHYGLSCVIPVFNGEEHLKEAIDSVLAQSLDFFENIQAVAVNDGSTDGTERICLEYREKYPYNFSYAAHADNLGVSAARNTGLRLAMGEYVVFLDADDRLDPLMFEKGVKALADAGEAADVAAFPVRYFKTGSEDNDAPPASGKTETVDVEEEPRRVLFGACAAVMRASALTDVRFDERLRFSEDAEFMHRVVLKKMKYVAVKEPAYMYRSDADDDSAMRGRTQNPAWYGKNRVFGEALVSYSVLTRGRVTPYTQHLIVHELLSCLTTEAPAEPPPRDALLGAFAGVCASLRDANEDVIRDAKKPQPWFKHFLLMLKSGEARPEYEDGFPAVRAGGEAFDPPEIRVDALWERGGTLRVRGRYERPPRSGVVPVALCGERSFAAEMPARARREIFFFGCLAYEELAFSFEILVSGLFAEGGSLSFALRTDASVLPALPRFEKNTGFDGTEDSFFAGESALLTLAPDGLSLRAEPITNERLAALASARFGGPKGDRDADGAKRLLAEYLRMRPLFTASRVWLFMDGLQKAGSNAEHMFTHCAKLRDGIDKYFVIGKDTLDGWRLSDTGTVLEYGSDTHRLLCLFAEKFIVSEIGDDPAARIAPAGLRETFGGFFNGETVLLPREILTKEAARKLDAEAARVGLLSVSSESERRLAVETGGIYEKAVHTAGSPEYDTLADRSKRRILFMPAYREKLRAGEGLCSPDFADSAYCAAINEFLCDERLFDAADEYGYAFDFAPHEKTYLQIADFEMDETVNIIPPGRVGRALLEEASLLVTDCMPASEAAYMGKPVVYYGFAEEDGLPGGCRFDDEESFPGGCRFGELIREESLLTDALLAYMKNDCAVSEEQKRGTDAFFVHRDGESRERIYRLLLEKAAGGGARPEVKANV